MDACMEVEPDTRNGEHNLSRQLADRPISVSVYSQSRSPSCVCSRWAGRGGKVSHASFDAGLRDWAACQHIGDTSR